MEQPVFIYFADHLYFCRKFAAIALGFVLKGRGIISVDGSIPL